MSKRKFELSGWVITERGQHDDEESAARAIQDFATSAPAAWRKFLAIVGKHDRRTWRKRGYVARRVSIIVTFEE